MNFSQIEYLTVFSSIIYGFVAAEYFHGWGDIFKLYYKKISFRFIIWSAFELALLVNIWWNTWIRNSRLSEHIGYFFLSLTTPIILYLISVITFPSSESKRQIDLYQYLKERFPKIMFLFFLLMISLIINTYFFNDAPFLRLEVYILFAAALLTLNGLIFNSNRAIKIIIAVAWILLLCHVIFVKNSFGMSSSTGFTQNEYLTIFIAILYGYVASVFFLGWGALIRSFKLNEVHWYHLAWTIIAFMLLVDIWWASWGKTAIVVSNITYFYASIIQPLIYYFLAIALFSVLKHKKENVHEKFQLASPLIFRLFALVLLSSIVISTVFNEFGLFHSKNLFRFAGIILAIIVSIKDSRVTQVFILVFAWIIYLAHLFVDEF
ncbi:MAG: hypothetical protein OEW67_11885 [Cyclobacteriaceae bacterium]|nr:hypothetical protein [Cyclobacteriaceae bacterium]